MDEQGYGLGKALPRRLGECWPGNRGAASGYLKPLAFFGGSLCVCVCSFFVFVFVSLSLSLSLCLQGMPHVMSPLMAGGKINIRCVAQV